MVLNRIKDKLKGNDFENKKSLEISEQIDLLIWEATSSENLIECYPGWRPWC